MYLLVIPPVFFFLQDGRTGLHVAAASAYHDVVKVLLYHKCTVDARDHDGKTPLYLATYHGNYEVMKMLVGAFANVNAVTKVISFELYSPLLFEAKVSSRFEFIL